MYKKALSLTVIVCFFLTTLSPLPKAQADSVADLPLPGLMVNLSPSYEPVIIKGLTVHKDNPFLFDFIVDVGQDKMSGELLKKEGERLIKYFLASLTIPDKDVWVNLSPYEKTKMIPEALGQTDMGRDLLEQDYILKQITASLIYPEKHLGRTFWDKVYAQVQEKYGPTQIPVNTFNKVWIMADRAEVLEHNQTAFVVDSHLKVMLEEDYLALQKHVVSNNTHSVTSDIIRQIILPQLEKEVNKGKNFAQLRQIFNSIILASWYKKALKESLLDQVYADKSKVRGINLNDPAIKEKIYEQYLKAYKKGVFNYIKEEINTEGMMVPRKYFSGGINEAMAADPLVRPLTLANEAQLANSLTKNPLVDMSTLASTKKEQWVDNFAMITPATHDQGIIKRTLGKLRGIRDDKKKEFLYSERVFQLVESYIGGTRGQLDILADLTNEFGGKERLARDFLDIMWLTAAHFNKLYDRLDQTAGGRDPLIWLIRNEVSLHSFGGHQQYSLAHGSIYYDEVMGGDLRHLENRWSMLMEIERIRNQKKDPLTVEGQKDLNRMIELQEDAELLNLLLSPLPVKGEKIPGLGPDQFYDGDQDGQSENVKLKGWLKGFNLDEEDTEMVIDFVRQGGSPDQAKNRRLSAIMVGAWYLAKNIKANAPGVFENDGLYAELKQKSSALTDYLLAQHGILQGVDAPHSDILDWFEDFSRGYYYDFNDFQRTIANMPPRSLFEKRIAKLKSELEGHPDDEQGIRDQLGALRKKIALLGMRMISSRNAAMTSLVYYAIDGRLVPKDKADSVIDALHRMVDKYSGLLSRIHESARYGEVADGLAGPEEVKIGLWDAKREKMDPDVQLVIMHSSTEDGRFLELSKTEIPASEIERQALQGSRGQLVAINGKLVPLDEYDRIMTLINERTDGKLTLLADLKKVVEGVELKAREGSLEAGNAIGLLKEDGSLADDEHASIVAAIIDASTKYIDDEKVSARSVEPTLVHLSKGAVDEVLKTDVEFGSQIVTQKAVNDFFTYYGFDYTLTKVAVGEKPALSIDGSKVLLTVSLPLDIRLISEAFHEYLGLSYGEVIELELFLQDAYRKKGIRFIEAGQTASDFSMAGKKDESPGGIDLNTSNMAMTVIKDANGGVKMLVRPKELGLLIERVRREGIGSLSPIVFKVTPISSVWQLVGGQVPVK